jgi:hypothetical protein
MPLFNANQTLKSGSPLFRKIRIQTNISLYKVTPLKIWKNDSMGQKNKQASSMND